MSKTDLALDERKKVGLLILDEIERVSKVLGIKYYLAYGTLLGAIRHNGYIPWDDDVDIWMLRADFDLFLSKFNEICSKDFKILSWYDNPDYPYYVPKVVYLKTEVRERWMKKRVRDLGIWVDVFCLNYISADTWESELKEEMYTLELSRRTALFRYMCFFSKLDILRMVFKNRDKHVLKCILKKPFDYTMILYSKMKGDKSGDKLIPVDHLLHGSYIFDASWFCNTAYHEYEGKKYPIPIGWKDILENIYGDYMTPPPEKERRLKQHIAYARWVR